MQNSTAPVAHLSAGIAAVQLRRFLAAFSTNEVVKREGDIGERRLLDQGEQAVTIYCAAANALAAHYNGSERFRRASWWEWAFSYCAGAPDPTTEAVMAEQIAKLTRQLRASCHLDDQALAEALGCWTQLHHRRPLAA